VAFELLLTEEKPVVLAGLLFLELHVYLPEEERRIP
jgi:hypothetical protein